MISAQERIYLPVIALYSAIPMLDLRTLRKIGDPE